MIPQTMRRLLRYAKARVVWDSYGASGLTNRFYAEAEEALIHEIAHWAVLPERIKAEYRRDLHRTRRLSDIVGAICSKADAARSARWEERALAGEVIWLESLGLLRDRDIFLQTAVAPQTFVTIDGVLRRDGRRFANAIFFTLCSWRHWSRHSTEAAA